MITFPTYVQTSYNFAGYDNYGKAELLNQHFVSTYTEKESSLPNLTDILPGIPRLSIVFHVTQKMSFTALPL